jgi:hypothetical protein
MFWAAFAQAFLSAIGIALIWRTLTYTRDAAESAKAMVTEAKNTTAAAVEATREAKRQVDFAEQSSKRLERPYIYIYGVHQIQTTPGTSNWVKYSVANLGRTPAKIASFAAGMSIHPHKPLDPLIVDYRDDPNHDLLVRPILPANEIRNALQLLPPAGIHFHAPKSHPGVMSISAQDLVPVMEADDQFFVWIRIWYRGPDGEYVTNACWRFDKLTKRLVPWGENEKYNGMT